MSDGRLRILGIADAGASHTHKWANYFARQQHNVHLVSYVPLLPDPTRALDPLVTVERWNLPNFHLKRPWITIGALLRLRRIIADWRPDIVQVHFLGAGAWYAALAGSQPLAVWVMGGDLLGSTWQPRSLRERVLSPLTLRRARLVLCWSPNLLAMVQPFISPSIPGEVVVGGVDTEVFRRRPTEGLRAELGLDPDAFVILSPRLMWPLYNIEAIVRALPQVLKEQPRARLLIMRYRATSYPDYALFLEAEVARLGLQPFVRFLPEIANSEMPAYLSLADCVVSIPETDGTPMAVMEALACGTPSLILDLPNYDSALFQDGRTVLRVPLRSPEGLAKSIVTLAANPDLRSRLGREGRRLVEERVGYTSEMRRLEGLYQRLVEGPTG